MPTDVIPGSTQVLDWPERWLVEFGSGEWRVVHVRARARDCYGREVIDCEYVTAAGTWLESYVADWALMRPPG